MLAGLGLVPSFAWLSFYLKKDTHPEPAYLIARVFFVAILLAPLAIVAQWIFSRLGSSVSAAFSTSDSILFFVVAAFIEEYVKYMAVKYTVLHNNEFDEPIDAMIYMIVAGLGFAAIENILVMFQAIDQGLVVALQIWSLRFAGATLLHALSSAIVGYFLAMSWFYSHHSKKLITIGLLLATFFHATFNIIILTHSASSLGIIYLIGLLVIMAMLISILFAKINKRALSTTSFS
ncbi:MAG: PrsW family intramembrane metalloprotease [bacterium]|nr:PrsW family intramembrane metalloprotease [bacterium]